MSWCANRVYSSMFVWWRDDDEMPSQLLGVNQVYKLLIKSLMQFVWLLVCVFLVWKLYLDLLNFLRPPFSTLTPHSWYESCKSQQNSKNDSHFNMWFVCADLLKCKLSKCNLHVYAYTCTYMSSHCMEINIQKKLMLHKTEVTWRVILGLLFGWQKLFFSPVQRNILP